MSHFTPTGPEFDITHFRARLEKRRATLVEDDMLSQESAATVELDQTRQGRLSRMDALQQQAMAAETHRRREQELRRLDAALIRVNQGNYGFCLTCGEHIAPGRLEIDPAVTQCVQCAELRGG